MDRPSCFYPTKSLNSYESQFSARLTYYPGSTMDQLRVNQGFEGYFSPTVFFLHVSFKILVFFILFFFLFSFKPLIKKEWKSSVWHGTVGRIWKSFTFQGERSLADSSCTSYKALPVSESIQEPGGSAQSLRLLPQGDPFLLQPCATDSKIQKAVPLWDGTVIPLQWLVMRFTGTRIH